MTVDEAEIKQNKYTEKLDELRTYPAMGSKYIGLKESVSKNIKKFCEWWEKIVYGFKNGILLLPKKDDMKTDTGNQQLDILDTLEQRRFNDFLSQIKEEQKNVDLSLFEEVFGYKTPDKMLQTLHNLKRVDSHNQEAFPIENIIVTFENKVKKMPEGVNKNKRKEILKVVSKNLDFNLNEWNQRGVRLKILTPNQMLNILPNSLAQLKAGNNSEKLKNKIRQLLYSLYRSKKLTKNIYKSLIDII